MGVWRRRERRDWKKKIPKKTPVESPPKLIEVKEEVESSEEEQADGAFECRKCGQRFQVQKDTNMEVLKKLHPGSCKGGKEQVERGKKFECR